MRRGFTSNPLSLAYRGNDTRGRVGFCCETNNQQVLCVRRKRFSVWIWVSCIGICAALFIWVKQARFQAELSVARSLYEAGDYGRAAEAIEQLLKDRPSNEPSLKLFARIAAAQQRWQAAVDALSKLKEKDADDLLLEAVLRTDLHQYGQAAQVWAQLHERSETADEKLAEYIRRLHQHHHVEQVVDLARSLSALPDAPFPIADETLAVIYRRHRKDARAAMHFEQAYRSRKSVSDLQRLDLAEAMLRIGRPEDVAKVLEPVEGTRADWLRARAYLQLGDIELARPPDNAAAFYSDPQIQEILVERGEPAPLIDAEACAECHRENGQHQSATPHARTFAPAGPVPWNLGETMTDPLDSRYLHQLQRQDGTVQAMVRGPKGNSHRLALIARMGSGMHGQTYLGRDDANRFWEYRLSWYPSAGWDLTTGQGDAGDPGGPMGKPLHWLQVEGCIRCHNTDTRAASAVLDDPSAASDSLGIRCESCHGPGGNHLRAVKLGIKDDLAIVNPRNLPAKQSVRLCANCHEPDHSIDPTDPVNARFQSATFTASKCFQQSDSFSCIRCHDPHHSVKKPARHYDQVCLSCHQTFHQSSPKRIDKDRACVDCHMPRIPGRMRHTTFADHNIRVHPNIDAKPEAETQQ